MKKLAFAAAMLGLSVIGASAADMAPRYTKAPPPIVVPVYSWTGLYGGGNVGWMSTDQSAFWPATALATNSFGHNRDGGTYGAHIGYQYQWTNFVLGIEAAWSTPFDNALVTGSPQTGCPNVAFTCRSSLTEIFTVGPRAGYAWNDVLLYGTGGYAEGKVRSLSLATATLVQFDDVSRRKDGWFAGVGVEYAAWKSGNISGIIGVEYQHVDLGSTRLFSPGDGNVFGTNTRDISSRSDLVRLRLSLKFDPSAAMVVAKY
jgi:outer membrane immunogenic protein